MSATAVTSSQKSELTLSDVLPNTTHALDGVGFLFGSGTSAEAGYPMMPELTRDVVAQLTTSERSDLDAVLNAHSVVYETQTGLPNIEHLMDLTIAHRINSGDNHFHALENRICELILDRIQSVTAPAIDNHCKFFEGLKKLAFGLPHSIWIFTTNYDLLFETAAARAGVAVENGFCGTTERFFCPSTLRSHYGEIVSRRFSPSHNLTVRLVKLHGSISWYQENSQLFERYPSASPPSSKRVLIYPRRGKVMDTLEPPYDTLFSHARQVLGNECKYLVSCGFSFSDEHITQQLLLPVMRENKCRLFALNKAEQNGYGAFKTMPNFQAGHDSTQQKTEYRACETDAWRFSQFVKLFE